VKFVTLVVGITTAYALGFPLAHAWVEWFRDVHRFSYDPVFLASYSTTKRLFYALFPMAFVVAGMVWWALVFRQHRKTYYATGWNQGTVMWVFGKPGPARGHLYDLFSALHGFKVIPWEAIPRPWTGAFFDGKTVVYWRSTPLQSPFSWHKDVIPDPDRNFRETLTTIYALADRRVSRHHRYNPKCDYSLLTARDVLDVEGKSLEDAIEKEKALNYQITEDVQRLARANPDVANDMAHRDIPIPRTTRAKLIEARKKVRKVKRIVQPPTSPN
jgi:hypothetical protein